MPRRTANGNERTDERPLTALERKLNLHLHDLLVGGDDLIANLHEELKRQVRLLRG